MILSISAGDRRDSAGGPELHDHHQGGGGPVQPRAEEMFYLPRGDLHRIDQVMGLLKRKFSIHFPLPKLCGKDIFYSFDSGGSELS